MPSAINTARTTERLNFLSSKLITKEPMDAYFEKYPVVDYFWSNKETDVYGNQVEQMLDTSNSPNFRWFEGVGTTFTTTIKNTVRRSVYDLKDCGITIPIDHKEIMEASSSDEKAYSIAKNRKENAQSTIRENLNTAIVATGNGSDRIIGLPNLVDATTTSIGNFNRSTDTFFQAQVTSSIGAFATNGLTNMRTGRNLCWIEKGNYPDFGVTTRSIHESFEAQLDPDVRYTDYKKLGRGALNLIWSGFPVEFSQSLTTGEMYFLNKDAIKMYVDSRANMAFDPYIKGQENIMIVAKILLRLAVCTFSPRELWKGTGIT